MTEHEANEQARKIVTDVLRYSRYRANLIKLIATTVLSIWQQGYRAGERSRLEALPPGD